MFQDATNQEIIHKNLNPNIISMLHKVDDAMKKQGNIMQLKENHIVKDDRRYSELLNLTNIGLKKTNFDLETLEVSMEEFRQRVHNMNTKIPNFCEIFMKLLICDRGSKRMKIYNRTIHKIRDFLDVNNLIKTMIEFQFVKKILFSNTALKLFKSFTEVKTLNNEKVGQIHHIFKKLYENVHSIGLENQDERDKESKDMDVYMAEFFLNNAMDNKK
jgi:hypothetical protein